MTSPHRIDPAIGERVTRPDEMPSIGTVVDMVKTYAKQETVGPLKGAGRWLAMGAAGAACLGVGAVLMLLGLLRLIQTEWDRSARGNLSWLAYLIVLVVAAALIALAVSRINRDTIDDRRTNDFTS
ncbi:MAG: phage holin family protein [Actinomycetota bacterium]|nr:phage holin family protein [Acidimicrobiia bacterium]MDQ3468518.1 phage holin family protein [Actinomycetota bacterium]